MSTHRSIMDGAHGGGAGNVSQIIINDTERIGLRILFEHISSATFHDARHQLNDANCTIVREWTQKWTPRLKTLSISDLSSISAIQAQQHNSEKIIVDVFTWLSDLSSPYPIMWIHHQDRSQTSFFAHVIADVLDELGKLSGSFFCTEANGSINIGRIIPTLAFQLAQNIPGTRPLIAQIVVQNPSIFDVRAKSQIRRLIINPLLLAFQSCNLDTRGIPNVFLIHGLEEFDDAEESQLSFLYAFSDALIHLATEDIPYRVLLLGRDSSYINKCLSNTDLQQKILERSITVPVSLGEEKEDQKKKREAKKRGDDPWRLMNTLSGHANSISSLIFSVDGTRLASASIDNTVRLWEGKTGNPVAILNGHSGDVHELAFSPDGSRLASGSADKTVRLWDVKSGSLVTTLQGHSSGARSVVFSPNGSRLASGSEDNTVRLWDGKTGSLVAVLTGHTGSIWDVEFSADGSILASGSLDHTVRLWDGNRGGLIATLLGHSQYVQAVAFSPCGSTLASASDDMTVRLWEGKKGSLVANFDGHSSAVQSIAFSPDGLILASGARDSTVRLWDVKMRSLITILHGHSGGVQAIAFSPDGSILASGSFDNTVRLWNVKTRSFITALDSYCPWLHSIAFSPDGLSIAFPSSDHTVRIWH